MGLSVMPVENAGPKHVRLKIDQIDGGISTRTFSTLLPGNRLQVATNAMFLRDGIVSKRNGNVTYGGGGTTGSGSPAITSMTRFYTGAPKAGILIVTSGTSAYSGNDGTGVFTKISGATTLGTNGTWAPMYDPTSGKITLFYADGTIIPQRYDTTNGWQNVLTGVSGGNQRLPLGVKSGANIVPKFVFAWNYRLVYANEQTDTGAVWISDALNPEWFNGFSFVNNANTTYIPYYPAGQDGQHGDITGLAALGSKLIIFYNSGVATLEDTGTYGSYEFVPQVISRQVGCVAPKSIAIFDNYVVFYGGDRFYATDGNVVVPFADYIPTFTDPKVPSLAQIVNPNSIVGVREGPRYWAAFSPVGIANANTAILVFDTSANGGYTFGQNVEEVPDEVARGGAWSYWSSGMHLLCGVECRGPGDSLQVFWGASDADQVYQFAPNIYSDNGAAIAFEVRTKQFMLEDAVLPKFVQAEYPYLSYSGLNSFTSTPTPYVMTDGHTALNATTNPSVVVPLNYQSFFTPKTAPASTARGSTLTVGITESSTNEFSVAGFTIELTEEPNPLP